MNAHSPREYWSELAENFAEADAKGLAPVLHPGAPDWFNRMIDGLQFRAIRRALALANLPPGSRVLDVGCGTGRWVRRYGEMGLRATGVDATSGMLRLARQRGTADPLIAGEANRLPLRAAAFDCVSDITVVQHIPAPLQLQALNEMVRVLKPGGRLILMELTRGKGTHIFPRTPQDWIQQVVSCGAKLIGWFGQEFLLLDRLFVRVAQIVRGGNSGRAGQDSLPESAAQRKSLVRSVYWGLRHVTAPLSAWVDPLAERIFPAQIATHGVFVFRKVPR
ncbi:MAG: methyltransferase domain-containing protein [Candidatus Acidiferrales bacterium]